jgi:hypothetical protein
VTEIKVHRPRYRLADKLRRGDQITASRALAQARSRVDSLAAATLEAVDRELALLEAAAASSDPEARAEGILAAADRIAGLVGALEKMQDMAGVAFGLCALVEKMSQGGLWDDNAVEVHVAGLRILRGGVGQMEAQALLTGLQQVRARLSRSPAPGPTAAS